MKKIILYTSTVCLLFSSAAFISSCGGSKDAKQNETNPVTTDSTKTTAAAYVCPMGPQCGTGETAGKCPSCGMEMVKNEKK